MLHMHYSLRTSIHCTFTTQCKQPHAVILDFVAMQSLFQAGDMTADVNGDGALTILDFIAFQALFLQGC